jgi:hypothetical protein
MRALVTMLALWQLAGCRATYDGPARTVNPQVFAGPGWLRAHKAAFVRAPNEDSCGPAVVAMMLAAHGMSVPTTMAAKGGASARELRDELRARSLRAFVVAGSVADLERELTAGRPVIVGTMKEVGDAQLAHFELVIAFQPVERNVVTLDPAVGLRMSSLQGFELEWSRAKHTAIVALPASSNNAAREEL